jgi:phage gp46-like protein
MSVNLYEGDPKIFLTVQGAKFEWRGGQPIMDAGLENTALFLLLIKPGWAGNFLFDNKDHRVGQGRYLEAVNQPITATSLTDAEQAAEQDLQPLKDWGLATDITAEVTNPQGKEIHTRIEITPPDRDPVVLLGIKNGVNWIFQATDPAHRRFQ